MAGDEPRAANAEGYRRLERVERSSVEERVLDRLDKERHFYDRSSRLNHRFYVAIKITQLVTAALIPVLAVVSTPGWVTGAMGSAIVVMEGIQQLFQFQERWIASRSTWQALTRERSLYEAQAGAYAEADVPHRALAERVVELVGSEHTRWLAVQERAAKEQPKTT
jgi:hypothetical protein